MKVWILILAMFAAMGSLGSVAADYIDPESVEAQNPPEDFHVWDVILGFETYELDSSGQYTKTEYQIVDERYGHLFIPRE